MANCGDTLVLNEQITVAFDAVSIAEEVGCMLDEEVHGGAPASVNRCY